MTATQAHHSREEIMESFIWIVLGFIAACLMAGIMATVWKD